MGFVSGLDLSRAFYTEAVRPLFEAQCPGLPHSAALIGPGSEVLGYDSPRSTDHDWGPRVLLFLRRDDLRAHGRDLSTALAHQLPRTFLGYPTNFESAGGGSASMRPTDGPVQHRVMLSSPPAWWANMVGFDVSQPPTVVDWLAMPWQKLAEVTGGEVFHDGLGALEPVRARLAWYPDDVWRYVLACQWQRIAEEEPFVGRAAEAGDPIGAGVLAARLVRDVMRLYLLMNRRWPPYGKWLGTAYGRLAGASELTEALWGVLTAGHDAAREARLCRAYEMIAELHNELGLTEPLDPTTRYFHDRPYGVLDAGRFGAALVARITDPRVRELPLVGAVDQFVDSTEVLSHSDRARTAALLVLQNQTGGDRLPDPAR
ncbi:DUF4037 domain-containing protein [Luedemannella flava]|uniref:DUF4037 domain-containing protein n=1 Tax=Luedemannella flava TaxID=349316 RepID=A0ABP4XT41_9ACTN